MQPIILRRIIIIAILIVVLWLIVTVIKLAVWILNLLLPVAVAILIIAFVFSWRSPRKPTKRSEKKESLKIRRDTRTTKK
jgi:uncharacterized membrane protein